MFTINNNLHGTMHHTHIQQQLKPLPIVGRLDECELIKDDYFPKVISAILE